MVEEILPGELYDQKGFYFLLLFFFKPLMLHISENNPTTLKDDYLILSTFFCHLSLSILSILCKCTFRVFKIIFSGKLPLEKSPNEDWRPNY